MRTFDEGTKGPAHPIFVLLFRRLVFRTAAVTSASHLPSCPPALVLSPKPSRPPALVPSFGLALACLLLSACSSPLVQPGPQTVDGLRLSTPIAWSDLGRGGQRLWTRDGMLLNALRIYTDIEPGEHVFRARLRGKKDEGARFRAGLSEIEISELIVEGLRGSGLSNVEALNLRPSTLNSRHGFRAELRFDSASGLHYRGLLLAEGADGSLSFLMYTAPAEFYFERDRASVEAIFDSLAR